LMTLVSIARGTGDFETLLRHASGACDPRSCEHAIPLRASPGLPTLFAVHLSTN